MRYREKSLEVDAFQYDGDLKGSDGNYYVPDWAVDAFEKGILFYASPNKEEPPCELYLKFPTSCSAISVSVGDYIIKNNDGNLSLIGEELFEAMYEKI